MSYEIKITADTITELTGKLLALAAATQPDVASGVAAVAPIDTKPKARGTTAAKAKAPEIVEEKGNAVEPEDAAAEPATPSDDAGNDTAGTSTTSTESAQSTEVAPKPLDFDKDVAPVVLNAVKVHTKEWVQEILSQFGFARASQVPDEQLPELVETLKAGPQ